MRNVVLLGLVSLLTDISTEMVYPLLPFYLTLRLGAGPAVLGLIEGLAESLASLLKVVSGHVSDRFQRRKPLAVLGYASSGLGKVVLYLAGSWGVVLAGRLVDRFGKGIRTAPRDALVADSSPEGRRGWAFGLHRAMDTAGAATGVLIAYFLLNRYGGGGADLRPIFLVSLIPALLGLAVLAWVRETGRVAGRREAGGPGQAVESAPRRAEPRPVGRIRDVFTRLDPRLKTLLIVTGIFTLGNSSNQFLLLRAGGAVGPAGAILLYLLYNLSYSVFSWPAGWLSDKVGRRRVLVAGFLLYAAVYGGMALGPEGAGGLGSVVLFALLFTLYGLYSALTDGVAKALIADLAPKELRATVIGLHATIVGLGLLPASLLAGALWAGMSPSAAFGFGAVAGLAAAVGLAVFPRPTGRGYAFPGPGRRRP
jgi:MFS family permease